MRALQIVLIDYLLFTLNSLLFKITAGLADNLQYLFPAKIRIQINFSALNIVMMQLCLVQAVVKLDGSFFWQIKFISVTFFSHYL